MRDMSETMKLHFVAPLLRKRAAKAKADFDEHIASYASKDYGTELFSCMEYADRMFKAAAEQKLFTFLARYCEDAHSNLSHWIALGEFDEWKADALATCGRRERQRITEMTEENALDVTFEMMKKWVADEFQYLSPLPRSTSTSHNTMEQSMLHAVMEFQRDRMALYELIGRAQRLDPEYIEWAHADALKAKAERDKRDAENALKELRAEEARKAVKKYVRTTAVGRNFHNTSALLGWPTLLDVQRIRNDDLRSYVSKVHELFSLGTDGKAVKK